MAKSEAELPVLRSECGCEREGGCSCEGGCKCGGGSEQPVTPE